MRAAAFERPCLGPLATAAAGITRQGFPAARVHWPLRFRHGETINLKTILIACASLLGGLAAGYGAALISYSNPGPDFSWIQAESGVPRDLAATDRPQPPKLVEVVDGEAYDFGVMDRGETRSHTFLIRNHSQLPLELEIGSTTCKCTVGKLKSDSIPPQGTGEVTLEWSARSLDTEFRQSATIKTNNDFRPTILLSVFGRVLQIVQAVPNDIAFSDVTIRDERTADLMLYGYKDTELDIIEYRWVNEDIADFFEFEYAPAEVDPLAKEQGALAALACQIRMKPGLPLGPVRQLLEVKTTASRSGVLDVPVRARVTGDVSLTGSGYNDTTNQLRLDPIRREAGLTHKLFLTVKGPHAPEFTIESVTVDPSDILQVTFAEPRSLRGGAVRMVPFEIRVPPGVRSVNYSGGEEHPLARITLHTNHPDVQQLGFDVRFVVIE